MNSNKHCADRWRTLQVRMRKSHFRPASGLRGCQRHEQLEFLPNVFEQIIYMHNEGKIQMTFHENAFDLPGGDQREGV